MSASKHHVLVFLANKIFRSMSQIHHSLHSTGTGAGFDDGVTMWAVGDELAVVVV